ncbi:EpsG family protein [Simplicispira hankyongi]|uniref:EpsG family protein n=1 Tax=Simplicispira hankyongi TaxID=2315688 RepID=A0A398CJQ0_9BURK|nr:EpsG family protein [Simplicispira hankyongi]RID99990.1 hypothetical protein D3F03_06350 [Simplicispira hankyongi]
MKMLIRKSTLLNGTYLFLASGYAYFFASIDRILNVNFVDILDRTNYVYYAEAPGDIFDFYLNKSILTALFNEPIFVLINWVAGNFLADPELIVRMLIFFSALSATYLALKNSKNIFYCFVILSLPLIFGNYVFSIRQGVALSFFLAGWFSKNRLLRVLLMAIAPFVHISFLIPIIFILVEKMIKKFDLLIYLNLLIFAFICFLVILVAPYAGEYLGVRQTEGYYYGVGDVESASGLGFVFWVVIFASFVGQGRDFLSRNVFAVYCIIFYLISYILFPPFARTVQNHALIILMSGFYLSGICRMIFNCSVGLFFLYVIFGALEKGFLHSFLV